MADMTTEAIRARDEARRVIAELIARHGEALPLPFVSRLEGARDWLENYEESGITPEEPMSADASRADSVDISPMVYFEGGEPVVLHDGAYVEAATCVRCGRRRPRVKLAKLTEKAGGGLACRPGTPDVDECRRISSE